jgi:hypothetical protein
MAVASGDPPVAAAAPEGEARASWRCRFCGTANADRLSGCRSCGAAREAAATSEPEPLPSRDGSPPAGAANGRRVQMLAAVALVAALLGAAAGYLGSRRGEESVTIAGFEWERTVEVQDHDTVREESWADEVPDGAHIVARRREVDHTERQQVGTRKGEPVYRERPVYRQRVAYDIERWKVVRTLRAAGKDQSPRWPDIRLSLGEREGKRGESYVVLLQGRALHRMRVPRERWQEMREGQIGTAVLDAGGAVQELR